MCFRMVERQCCKIEKGEGLCINSRWYCSGAESWKQFCHECEASSSTWNIAHQKPTPSKQHNLLNTYKIMQCKIWWVFFHQTLNVKSYRLSHQIVKSHHDKMVDCPTRLKVESHTSNGIIWGWEIYQWCPEHFTHTRGVVDRLILELGKADIRPGDHNHSMHKLHNAQTIAHCDYHCQ